MNGHKFTDKHILIYGTASNSQAFPLAQHRCSQISRQILCLAYYHAIFCISPNSLRQQEKLIF